VLSSGDQILADLPDFLSTQIIDGNVQDLGCDKGELQLDIGIEGIGKGLNIEERIGSCGRSRDLKVRTVFRFGEADADLFGIVIGLHLDPVEIIGMWDIVQGRGINPVLPFDHTEVIKPCLGQAATAGDA